MKNLKTFLFSFIILTFISCESDSDNEIINANPEDEVSISHFINKTLSLDNSILSSTTFQLENNKIISSANENNTSTQEYEYVNNKISSVSSYNSGALKSKTFFLYDNHDLIEYRIEDYSPTAFHKVIKHNFTHTNDTIYSEMTRTQDGTNYELFLTSKMKLVNNGRVYFEQKYETETDIVTMVYDANDNPVTETLIEADGLLTNTNQMAYDSTKSCYAMIMEKTYSRKTLLMIYHRQSAAINNINAKILAKNNMMTLKVLGVAVMSVFK